MPSARRPSPTALPGLVAAALRRPATALRLAEQREATREWVLSSLVGSRLVNRNARAVVLRALGVPVGARATIGSGITWRSRGVRIGHHVFVNADCFLDGPGAITIGDETVVGMRAMLLTSTHDVAGPRRRADLTRTEPVVIGRGCWIGAAAVVLPGVTVGDGCVVAAGAVVTSDCAPNGLYAGVPARRVRDLPV